MVYGLVVNLPQFDSMGGDRRLSLQNVLLPVFAITLKVSHLSDSILTLLILISIVGANSVTTCCLGCLQFLPCMQ